MNWLLPHGDEARAEQLPDKCTIGMHTGDVLLMVGFGAGLSYAGQAYVVAAHKPPAAAEAA